ncbi:hypothetical protein ScPMuIL_005759 [Solemya velum]
MADEVNELARQMDQYLISHDKAAKQVLILDEHIQQITKRALNASENDSTRTSHLMLRKSVVEGVREMYQQYRRRKWKELQKFVKEVISRLQPDGVAVSADIDDVPGEDGDEAENSEGTEMATRTYAEYFCSIHRTG